MGQRRTGLLEVGLLGVGLEGGSGLVSEGLSSSVWGQRPYEGAIWVAGWGMGG